MFGCWIGCLDGRVEFIPRCHAFEGKQSSAQLHQSALCESGHQQYTCGLQSGLATYNRCTNDSESDATKCEEDRSRPLSTPTATNAHLLYLQSLRTWTKGDATIQAGCAPPSSARTRVYCLKSSFAEWSRRAGLLPLVVQPSLLLLLASLIPPFWLVPGLSMVLAWELSMERAA